MTQAVTLANAGVQGSAKAWVSYNGGTQTILASFNVSSVTYSAIGTYIINFTTALVDAKYSGVCSGSWTAGLARPAYIGVNNTVTKTSSAFPIIVMAPTTYGTYDPTEVNVSIFR